MNDEQIWYWHIHHEMLAERADEPIKNRIAYIKSEKPQSEVASRLKLLKRVKNQKRMNEINEAYDKATAPAWEAYKKAQAPAWEAYRKATAPAWEAYWKAKTTALEKRLRAINALHAKECKDCPWDGNTIFPKNQEMKE